MKIFVIYDVTCEKKNVLTEVEKFVAAVSNKDKELLSSEINN